MKIDVEYVELKSDLPFSAVVEAFENATGSVEGPGYSEAVQAAHSTEQFETIIRAQEGTSGFMRFLTLDHGAWMRKFDSGTSQSRMYTVGNPLLARTMLRHDMAAGLNVPVRVHIFEGNDGKTRLAYHLPSSLMSAYGNPEVQKAYVALDEKLARLAQTVMGNQ